MEKMFTKEELIQFNEILLQRGVPNKDDGIGYNKADYSPCSTYYYGLSNSQYADLAKRLVKYSNTQLKVDRQMMIYTYNELAKIANPDDRSNGISLNITENGTLISFRYNDDFISIMKKQQNRQWDSENKNWVIPNENVIKALKDLEEVGADVENAISYAMNHELINKPKTSQLTEVLTKMDGDYALLKFQYNKDIVNEIKQIDKKDRQWNAEYKFWAINKDHLQMLQNNLATVAEFKQI